MPDSNSIPKLPPRPTDGHKGTFGTVCVVGGRADDQHIMVGGPAFAALGALRSGCGLAVLAVPMPIMAAALVIAPSATGLALPVDEAGRLKPSEVAQLLDRSMSQYKCLAIGPGFGSSLPQQQILVRLIAQDAVPLVIDADGLNALASMQDFQHDLRGQVVLTPHPGEFKKLAHALGITGDPIDRAKRPGAASMLAQRLGCIVVLKGQQTIVTDGVDTHINQTGNVALATGGSGDVLTGIIAGFIAQFFKPSLGTGTRQITPQQQGALSLLQCAQLAVHVHGLAADQWALKNGSAGMLAMDLIGEIPKALSLMRT